MSWYLRNATATRFGATRKCLDSTDATASASGESGAVVAVTLYTCTSAGALTQRATGNYTLTVDLAKAARTITLSNIAADIDIPTGGGIAVAWAGQTFFSTVEAGHVLKAGSHQFTVTFEASFDGDLETWVSTLYYGAQQAFGPDNIFYAAPAGTPPTVTTHPSNATDRTFAQSTSFTAAASGDPAPTVVWQVLKPGGAWTNITGATSTTLTINAAGHNFQYRAVFTNTAGTATSNAATLTMSTASPNIGAGTYAADTLSDYLSYRGSTAVAITGAVVTTGIVIIDNPSLLLSGTGTPSLTVAQVIFKAFKDIGGFPIHTGNWHVGKSLLHGIVFAADAHFDDVTGTALLHDCDLDGILWFGDPASGAIHNSQYSRVVPNLANVQLVDCQHDNFIRGAADGVTLLRMTGTVDAHSVTMHDYPLAFGGCDVSITDCDLTATFQNCVMKVVSHGRSSKNWHVSDGTFTGGTEEQTGCEAGYTRFVGHVTAKTATSITVAVDTNKTGGLRSDAQLLSNSEHVGCHALMLTGDAAGHYHEVTAQTGAVLTIDTTRWDTSAIAVDDVMMVAQAMVESLWENNTHILKRGYIDHGNGCNVGFSSYGNAFGNTVKDDFQFPTPLVLATTVPGNYEGGPAIAAADWAVGIDEFSGPNAANGPLMNAHNTYDGCTFDDNIPVAITVETANYSGETNETVRPVGYGSTPEFYSRGVTVKNCTYHPDAVVQVIDAKEMVWTANTTPAPSIKYTGLVSSCAYTQAPTLRWPYTYINDYTPITVPDWGAEPNWLWEYGFTLNADSTTTWGAPLDPSDVVLAETGTATWADNANNETGQRIRWTANGTTGDPIALAADVETAQYNGGDLSDVTTLYCEVQSTNASGDSAWAASNTLTVGVLAVVADASADAAVPSITAAVTSALGDASANAVAPSITQAVTSAVADATGEAGTGSPLHSVAAVLADASADAAVPTITQLVAAVVAHAIGLASGARPPFRWIERGSNATAWTERAHALTAWAERTKNAATWTERT